MQVKNVLWGLTKFQTMDEASSPTDVDFWMIVEYSVRPHGVLVPCLWTQCGGNISAWSVGMGDCSGTADSFYASSGRMQDSGNWPQVSNPEPAFGDFRATMSPR